MLNEYHDHRIPRTSKIQCALDPVASTRAHLERVVCATTAAGCSTFWRPEWRRSRRRTTTERLENTDDLEADNREQFRGVLRRDKLKNLRFSCSRSGNNSFSCSLAFCFCVVSVVLFLDRTVNMEITEQQYIGWSSKSAKLMYDHAQRSESPKFRSAASNLISAGGVDHERRPSPGDGSRRSDADLRSQRGKDEKNAKNTNGSISNRKENVEGWDAWKQTRRSQSLLKAKGALRGLGTTFRRGSRAMNELVVAHLDEQTTPTDLKLFLRTLHRSGVTARADVVILFPRGLGDDFVRALHDEEKSFWHLMVQQQSVAPIHVEHQKKNSKTSHVMNSEEKGSDLSKADNLSTSRSTPSRPISPTTNGGFLVPKTVFKQAAGMSLPEKLIRELKDAGLHRQPAKTVYFGEELLTQSLAKTPSWSGETPLKTVNGSLISRFNIGAFWHSREEGIRGKAKGRRRGGESEIPWENPASEVAEGAHHKKQASVNWGDWGSVVVFDMQDLGSEETLSGFIENPPAGLQRWMCYELLLGVVRKQYFTVLVTEITGVVLLGDVMSTVRNPASASAGVAFLFSEDRTWGQAHHEEIGLSEADSNGDLEAQKDHKLENVESPESRNRSGVVRTGRYKNFIRNVYGTKTWRKLEEEEFQKIVLVSGILLGNIKTIQSLSRAMTNEIVRVAAILRNSTEPFPDQPVLNYLVLKGTTLGRKLRGKLKLLPNGFSRVHIVTKVNQDSNFFQKSGGLLHALHGFKDELVSKATGDLITQSIYAQICSAAGASDVYDDCHVRRLR